MATPDEALADGVKDKLGLGSKAGGPKPAAGPERRTMDEVLADLNQSPLFMTELEENDDLAAIQALQYEGTPLENASDFRESGNERFRSKLWSDAREFYGRGIAVLVQEERRREKGEPVAKPEAKGESDEKVEEDPDDPALVAKQRALLATLYTNRAAAELALRNYGRTIADCGRALRLDPTNVKALYRSGRALLAVGRLSEAADAVARGLALDGANESLIGLKREVEAKITALSAKEREEKERKEREMRQRLRVRAALRARGITTRKSERPPEMEDAGIKLVEVDDDNGAGTSQPVLTFPVVLLYPLHLQSDFVRAFAETETMADHLAYVFEQTPPWDTEGEYTPKAVECYVETRDGGLIKLGKKVPLGTVLGSGKVDVVDELVRIFVVPRGKAENWVKEFKDQKAKEKK